MIFASCHFFLMDMSKHSLAISFRHVTILIYSTILIEAWLHNTCVCTILLCRYISPVQVIHFTDFLYTFSNKSSNPNTPGNKVVSVLPPTSAWYILFYKFFRLIFWIFCSISTFSGPGVFCICLLLE